MSESFKEMESKIIDSYNEIVQNLKEYNVIKKDIEQNLNRYKKLEVENNILQFILISIVYMYLSGYIKFTV